MEAPEKFIEHVTTHATGAGLDSATFRSWLTAGFLILDDEMIVPEPIFELLEAHLNAECARRGLDCQWQEAAFAVAAGWDGL